MTTKGVIRQASDAEFPDIVDALGEALIEGSAQFVVPIGAIAGDGVTSPEGLD